MKSDDPNDEVQATAEIPVVSPMDPRVTVIGAEIAAEAAATGEHEAVLPHWTEAPTGQVPAVLSRDAAPDDDPWATIPAPAWRENEADWVAHDEQFDASVLAPPTEDPVDARPWEFTEEVIAPVEEIVAESPRPAPSRPTRTRRPAENPLQGRAARAANTSESVRFITGFLLGIAVLVVFLMGTIPVMVVVCAALALAVTEAFASFRTAGAHPATALGLVATVALAVAAYNKGEVAVGLVTVLFLFFAALWYLSIGTQLDILDGIASTVFVYVWVGIAGCYAALLISPVDYPNRHGLAFLMGAILLTVGNDVGALFAGRFVGRHKLAPSISPGKTVEGLVGGVVLSLAVAFFLPEMHPWSLRSALVVWAALAVVVPAGDLFESLVKRTLGTKDMGGILPGHGGMLDRVDGLLFALPTTYYLVHVLNLG